MCYKISLSLSILTLFIVTSCATQVEFPVSKVSPGADITAKFKQDKNDNYSIDLEAKNLTTPDRLDPPKEMYVVWIETARGTKNLGKLTMSSGLFSSKRTGSLSTTSAFKPQRFLITAENSSTNNEPGTFVIVTSKDF